MSYIEERLDSQQLFDYIVLGQQMVVNIGVSFADTKHNQFCVDSDWNQISEKLTKNMTHLVELEQKLNNDIKASAKTEKQICQLISESENSEENKITDIRVNEIFDQNLAQIVAKDETKVEENQNYNKLMQIFEEFGNEAEENDDELMALTTEDERIPIDPFSKKEIENPVKNKTCGHIYDGEQLRLILEQRAPTARLRCPNVGCNNRSVTLKDVSVDHKTRALIQKLKRNQN